MRTRNCRGLPPASATTSPAVAVAPASTRSPIPSIRKPLAVAVAVCRAATDPVRSGLVDRQAMAAPEISDSMTSACRSASSASASPASTALTGCSGRAPPSFGLLGDQGQVPTPIAGHAAAAEFLGDQQARPAQFRCALPPLAIEGDAVPGATHAPGSAEPPCRGTTPSSGEQLHFGEAAAVMVPSSLSLHSGRAAPVSARAHVGRIRSSDDQSRHAGMDDLVGHLEQVDRLPPMTFRWPSSSRPCAARSSTRLTSLRGLGCSQSRNRKITGQRRSVGHLLEVILPERRDVHPRLKSSTGSAANSLGSLA